MGEPRNKFGTCRFCETVVVWKAREQLEEELAANKDIERQNDEIRKRNEKVREERWAKDDYSWYEAEKYLPIPFPYLPSDPRWTHNPEGPGEDKELCPNQEEVYQYNRTNASPKEYCCERTNQGDLCNRTASFHDDREQPYCKTHFEPIRQRQEQDARYSVRRAQQEWAEEVRKFKEDELKSYGLKDANTRVYSDEIQVIMDIDVILDLLRRVKGER